MKYTIENVTELLKNFAQLDKKAQQFINKGTDEKYGRTSVRINFTDMCIEEEVNTACNCHPEYNWEFAATIDDFVEWLEKQEVTENSTKA